MAGIHVIVPHTLGQQAAQVRVEQFLDKVREQYGHEVDNLRGAWAENRLEFAFTTRGLAIQGRLEVLQQQVVVAGPLPFAAMFFRGRIEQTIREQLEQLLE